MCKRRQIDMGIRHLHLGAGRPVKHPGRNLQPTVRIGSAQAAAKNSVTRPLDRRVNADSKTKPRMPGYSSSRNSVPWVFSSLVVQHDQAPRLNRIQATSTRGVRACIRRVAGCATPTGSAGHAGATAKLKLTFHLDHSAGG
jgi:hypothetical protein